MAKWSYLLYANRDQDNAGLQITDFLISRAPWPCTYEEDNQKQIQKVWIKKLFGFFQFKEFLISLI